MAEGKKYNVYLVNMLVPGAEGSKINSKPLSLEEARALEEAQWADEGLEGSATVPYVADTDGNEIRS
jgi:hypothetical protein